jgi:CheY-like chemotaxis protein
VSLKILLADDSMTAQNMGKKILLDAGYEVIAVSNGAAAIKRIASDRPDIIILDVFMPGYTGLEVCERVKGASETSTIPVLLTVGKMEPFKPEEANRVRADGLMIKPFEASDLIAVMQGIAKKMSSGGATDGANGSLSTSARDTSRIAAAKTAEPEPYEQTIRLTPEQVRSFQDKTYKEWVASSEPHEDKPEERQVMNSVPEPATVQSAAVEAEPAIEVEPAVVNSADLDSNEAATPDVSAGRDFFAVTPPGSRDNGMVAEDGPAMYSSSEETVVDSPSRPVFTMQQHVTSEPFGGAEIPDIMQPVTHELETSAPLTPGPSFAAQLEELEPNMAPPVEVISQAVPELEVNSPIFVQHDVDVTPDPGLVTSDDDMSQFVTSFGKPGAEEIHVGVASDLSPEQFAAVTGPIVEAEEIVQEVPQLDPPDVVLPPMVQVNLSRVMMRETVADNHSGRNEESVAPVPTNVLDEVGAMVSDEALSGSGPIIAYVPGMEDTQPIPAYVEPQSFQPESVDVKPVAFTTEPEFLIAEVQPEPVMESAPTASMIMEAASAAVVGGSAAIGAAHFFTPAEPAMVQQPSAAYDTFAASCEPQFEAPEEVVVESTDAVVPEAPAEELVGDAALAEELAAALADQEAQAEATAAPEAATSEPAEPVAAANESTRSTDSHTIADSKLSAAVSRALENLRPQLIAEIVKELIK